MNHNITLNLVTYIIFLCVSGFSGSCHQAYKSTGTVKPFLARILCGITAGNATVLVAYVFKIPDQPLFHLGIAVFLGMLAERKGGLGSFLDEIILKFTNNKEVKQ